MEFLKKIFLHKRMKSFYWRASGMLASELAFVVPSTLSDFNAPQWVIIGFGLVVGEVTKYLNTKK
jgi:hypothetical protein